MASFVTSLLNVLLVLTSVFLICLILIQRGKGGGLAGAFGGMGGSSAFGTKAGDVFTRVTIFVALFWGFLAILLVFMYNRPPDLAFATESANISKVKSTESKSIDGKGKETAPAGTGGTTPSSSDKGTQGKGSSSDSSPLDIPVLPDKTDSKK